MRFVPLSLPSCPYPALDGRGSLWSGRSFVPGRTARPLLRVLLQLKDRAQYGLRELTSVAATGALDQAEALVRLARSMVGELTAP